MTNEGTASVSTERALAKDSIAVRIYQESLRNLNKQLESGVYTEVHLTSDGEILISPDIIGTSVHLSSLTGYHSMWEQHAREFKEQLSAVQSDALEQLKLDTMSVVAKGTLIRTEQGKMQLRIAFLRPHRFEQIAGKDFTVDPERRLLEELVTKVPSIDPNLEVVTTIQGQKEAVLTKAAIPHITIENEFTVVRDPKADVDDDRGISSGFISYMSYSEEHLSPESKGKGKMELTDRTSIYLEIKEARAKRHQEARKIVYKTDTLPTVAPLTIGLSNRNIDVEGRHTVDDLNTTTNISISLQQRGANQELAIPLKEVHLLECSYFLSYITALLKQHPEAAGYTTNLITAYVDKQGHIQYSQIRIPKNTLSTIAKDQQTLIEYLLRHLQTNVTHTQ